MDKDEATSTADEILELFDSLFADSDVSSELLLEICEDIHYMVGASIAGLRQDMGLSQ